MKSIVVPTRNRPELLNRLVEAILPQLLHEDELIIIDSSDAQLQSKNLIEIPKIRYVTTEIRSAAVQRNIGLDLIGSSKYVFFLDDDVLPKFDYFEKCLAALDRLGAIGISGVALNSNVISLRSYPRGFIGAYRRIFLLDSVKDGILLKSGVNIPVRNYSGEISETDWLIGCSAWVAEKIGNTRFEPDFTGQSLTEDVIFSVRMSKKGKLVTDPSIDLSHEESEIARPNKKEFWQMWVINRYRLIEVANFGSLGLLSYWWANFGQLGILYYKKVRRLEYQSGSIKGLVIGALLVLGFKK